jgi:23S rRNA pseudouridine955/2504/2580 synthase
MNRYQLHVEEYQQGSKLLPLLLRAYPMAPEFRIRQALKRRDIKVDGRRVDQNVALKAGQLVEWYTEWAPLFIPAVYEDENVLVVNKPAGISSDVQAGEQIHLTLLLAAQTGSTDPFYLVHRLDHQTSGLLILAKTPRAEIALLEAFKQGTIDKSYTCLVKGPMDKTSDTLHAWLRKDAQRARVQVLHHPVADAREIVTSYRLLKEEDGCSRLEVQLHTGRTHQIRAHLADAGHPVLGDEKYGDFAFNRQQKATGLMLCATRLQFHTIEALPDLQGKAFSIPAPF